MTFTTGEKLRSLIKREGLKQVEVCRLVGLSPSRLSNYLSDSREPDLDTLSRMCVVLNGNLNMFSTILKQMSSVEKTAVYEELSRKGISAENLAKILSIPTKYVYDALSGRAVDAVTIEMIMSELFPTDKYVVHKDDRNTKSKVVNVSGLSVVGSWKDTSFTIETTPTQAYISNERYLIKISGEPLYRVTKLVTTQTNSVLLTSTDRVYNIGDVEVGHKIVSYTTPGNMLL